MAWQLIPVVATAVISNITHRALSVFRSQPALPEKIKQALRQNKDLSEAELMLNKRQQDREDFRVKAELEIAARTLKQQEYLGTLYIKTIQDQTNREISARKQELQALYDTDGKWASYFSPHELQRIFGGNQHRLLMIMSKPTLAEGLPTNLRVNLESSLPNKLMRFMSKYYSQDDKFCAVEFYGKFFDRSVFDAELKKLESILPVPMAFIYTDINLREVFVNLKLSGLDSRPLPFSCEEWDWRKAKQELLDNGLTEEESLEYLEDLIVKIHQTVAAFLADWYYLNINPYHQIHLSMPQLQDILPQEWIDPCVNTLRQYQQDVLNLIAIEKLNQETQKHLSTTSSVVNTPKKQPRRSIDRTYKIHSNPFSPFLNED